MYIYRKKHHRQKVRNRSAKKNAVLKIKNRNRKLRVAGRRH